MIAAAGLAAGLSATAAAQVPAAPNAFELVDELVDEAAEADPFGDETADSDVAEPGVSLPTDRGRERLLDRARRLAAGERWSDAVAMLDELLANEHDAFVSAGVSATQGSIRSETLELLEQLPRPGRAAYELLFRGRAETQLAAAIAADDAVGILAVARRWLHTPAGREAALIAAIQALEHGRPADASAWLDRVAGLPDAADLEPTLTLLRAVAREASGDAADAGKLLAGAPGGRSDVTLAGRALTLPPAADAAAAAVWLGEHVAATAGQGATAGEWRQFRGTPSRVGLGDASRPFLVPRYRVPLVRHPEEARRLERLRQDAADEDRPLMPAGTPLAVGDKVVVQTPLGLLAIDFESGRRVWLTSAVPMAEVDEAGAGGSLGRVFDDATSGNLASDGKLVFAVESPADALAVSRATIDGFGDPLNNGRDWEGGNTLTAYDLATGGARWRLPRPNQQRAGEDAAEPKRAAGGQLRSRWHLGPPLVAGDDLFLLVEEDGEVLVEARSAASGELRWWQPLASHDADGAITSGNQTDRRRAGLTSALDDGVLVCPIGSGCVLAIDVATRSLLWAHAYPRPETARELGRFGARELDGRKDEPARFGEPAPIIAGGRVILAPFDAETVRCLNLRDGTPVWQRPRGDMLAVAGVVDGRAVLVGGSRVEAIDVATGKRIWKRDLDEGVHPSGRGVLTRTALLLPCDTPGVVEVSVADGRIIGRSPARGGQIPGSLIAHRGEVISRGLDSLDVFHQEAALETRIETALKEDPASPWASSWQGQLAIERGDLEAGFDALAKAAAATDFTLPPGAVAAAVERGMQRDFPEAARRWAALPGPASARTSPGVLRMAVDGFLAAGDGTSAWPHLLHLLENAAAGEPGSPFRDPSDPRLTISEDRWLRGRLTRLLGLGDEPLRRDIDAALGRLFENALATADSTARATRAERLASMLGWHPAAERLLTTLAHAEAAGDRRTAVRRELLAIETTGVAASERQGLDGGGIDPETAWPLGRVERREQRAERKPQVIPLPLAGSGFGTRGARAAIDLTREQILISDDLGRLVTNPLPVAGLQGGFGLPFINQTAAVEVAVLDRAVFIRTAAGIAAYDLDGPPGAGRGLWQRPDLGTNPGDGFRWGGGVGGRVARDGAAPLGMRIDEPFDRPRGGGRGMVALPIGLVVPGSRSVTVLDPGTGNVLWSRHLLPAGLEWLADEAFLCGCTVDGRGSLVFATVDGRFQRSVDVPHRRQRVATSGRRLVGVTAIDDLPFGGVARRVRLELVDPADRETRPLGEFDGRARATETGDGRLAVMEPDGRLTAFDLVDGGVAFSQRLTNVPRAFERLHVQAWQDRYLVLAGGAGEDDGGDISPLEQLLLSAGSAAPLSGAIWALDRDDGRPLWPIPATVEQHCLHIAQPAGLPVLAFCRLVEAHGRGRQTLSVLLLDKRTGHAVFEDDRIELQAPTGQCELAADPDANAVTIGGFDAGRGSLVLTFTGGPMPPRPPFQSSGGPPAITLAPAGEQ